MQLLNRSNVQFGYTLSKINAFCGILRLRKQVIFHLPKECCPLYPLSLHILLELRVSWRHPWRFHTVLSFLLLPSQGLPFQRHDAPLATARSRQHMRLQMCPLPPSCQLPYLPILQESGCYMWCRGSLRCYTTLLLHRE